MGRNVSCIPFRLSKRCAILFLITLFSLDIFFIIAHLITSLPEVRELTFRGKIAALDMDVEANLPTNWAILKLYFASIVSALMIFWYEEKAPVFWKIAAVVLFYLGLDESAQLHELWGGSIAPMIFNPGETHGNRFNIIPYMIIFGSFYLFSLSLFPKNSKFVFACFFSSGLLIILSQAAELNFYPTLLVMDAVVDLPYFTDLFDRHSVVIAWEEGLELFSFSLISGGVFFGVSAIQGNDSI